MPFTNDSKKENAGVEGNAPHANGLTPAQTEFAKAVAAALVTEFHKSGSRVSKMLESTKSEKSSDQNP